MSVAYVTEFTELTLEGKGNVVPAPKHPATHQAPITYSASAASAAFGDNTRLIRIVSPVACHYKVSGSPVASVNTAYLPADFVEYIGVTGGDKIAFIDAA